MRLKSPTKIHGPEMWGCSSSRSSRKSRESRWLEGAYTLVKVRWWSEAVEERVVVKVWRLEMNPSREKAFEFQAVSMPPLVPAALMYWSVVAKCEGRKLCA